MTSAAVSEKELDEMERELGVQLPCDYRCSLRLQGKRSVPLGSVTLYSDGVNAPKRTFHLFGASDVRVVTIRPGKVGVGFLAIAVDQSFSLQESVYNMHDGKNKQQLLLMVINDQGARCSDCQQGHVFMAASSPRMHESLVKLLPRYHTFGKESLKWYRMPNATTFADWLSAEVERLQHYHISSQPRQLTRFTLTPDCAAVTGHFTVRIATAFLLSAALSWTCKPSLAVCLIVELSQDAGPEEYQLTEACVFFRGQEVRGSFKPPQPQSTLCPGHVVEYVNYIHFTARIGVILKEDAVLDGHIVMRSVQSKEDTRVNLPTVLLEMVPLAYFHEIASQ